MRRRSAKGVEKVATTIRISPLLKSQVQSRAAATRSSAEAYIEAAIRDQLRRDATESLTIPTEWAPATAQRLLECLPAPAVIKDSEARIVWCNLAYEDMLGLKRDAMLNKKISELNVLDGPSAERVERSMLAMQEESAKRSEPSEFWEPLAIKKREGRTGLFRAYRFFFRRASTLGVFLGDVSFDWSEIRIGYPLPPITDLESRLRASSVADGVQALFEPFLSGCPIAIAVKDNQTRLVWCNTEYENVVGRTLAVMKGQPTTAILGVSDVDHIVQREYAVIKNNQTQYSEDSLKGRNPRTSLRFPIVGRGGDVVLIGVVSAEFRQQDAWSRTPVVPDLGSRPKVRHRGR